MCMAGCFTVWFTGEKGELRRQPKNCPKNCYQKYHVGVWHVCMVYIHVRYEFLVQGKGIKKWKKPSYQLMVNI